MKYLMIAVLILLYNEVMAQVPPKKSTKIIVLVKDSASTLLNTIAKGLFDRGFTVETKDENTKTLSTKEFTPDHHSMYIKVRASINDSSVVFTGTYAWTMTSGLHPHPHEYTPIEFRGLKKSAAMHAWNSLDKIARNFGEHIVYSN
jgi:hypothetical protein